MWASTKKIEATVKVKCDAHILVCTAEVHIFFTLPEWWQAILDMLHVELILTAVSEYSILLILLRVSQASFRTLGTVLRNKENDRADKLADCQIRPNFEFFTILAVAQYL